MEKTDVLIVGGGPAGLAAAVKLYESGIRDILIEHFHTVIITGANDSASMLQIRQVILRQVL